LANELLAIGDSIAVAKVYNSVKDSYLFDISQLLQHIFTLHYYLSQLLSAYP
jgi:hypothetical protein